MSKLDYPPSISLAPVWDLKPDYLGLNLTLNASYPYAIPKKLNTSETQFSYLHNGGRGFFFVP